MNTIRDARNGFSGQVGEDEDYLMEESRNERREEEANGACGRMIGL